MEVLKYIVEDSTIAELLGVQNFSTDEAAVLELVKNAYDANALNLKIKFQNNQMVIQDDGIGMNVEDIKKHWMHIGKSDKKYEIIDDNNNKRIQAGSKGVGRFALSRLGCNIIMTTKKADNPGVVWKTDWNTSIIDTAENLIENGTTILIENLRERWNKKRINNLCEYIERTYFDDSMKIEIITDEFNKIIPKYFPTAEIGINCKSNLKLKYDNGILTTIIKSDEFDRKATKYCQGINLNEFESKLNVKDELKGSYIEEVAENDLERIVNGIGKFSANFYFNLSPTEVDKDKYLYKYTSIPEKIKGGIILYRNAFSISSNEGKKDWLGLGKRARKYPAAATHKSGSWRVRENQLAGYVLIDKKENYMLQDLANRQGLDENIYFQVFVEIICMGIKEFERYRQNIIRKIDVKNKIISPNKSPVSDRVAKSPKSIKNLTPDESKQLASEIKEYKKEQKRYQKDKEEVEQKYRYDVRILNVLATTGLKASSIAHEMKNNRNFIYENYENIVDALKEYGMWEELNLEENTRKSYKNVPYLLKNGNEVEKKLLTFMDTMLEEIEKNQFELRERSIFDSVNAIKKVWQRDYKWIHINLDIEEDIVYEISEDVIQVILDNLILNSIQQNDEIQLLNIFISAMKNDGKLEFEYRDNGKGLDDKYSTNPWKILEVHETTRKKGHGLGMWIVNNTCIMSGGEVQDIKGEKGFYIKFTLGGKI